MPWLVDAETHWGIADAAAALDAEALRGWLSSPGFARARFRSPSVQLAAHRAADAAVRAEMAPREALAAVCAELRRYDAWGDVEACVRHTLRRAGADDGFFRLAAPRRGRALPWRSPPAAPPRREAKAVHRAARFSFVGAATELACFEGMRG